MTVSLKEIMAVEETKLKKIPTGKKAKKKQTQPLEIKANNTQDHPPPPLVSAESEMGIVRSISLPIASGRSPTSPW